MQFFRGWTIRISTGCDEVPNSPKALCISSFKSGAFVDNQMVVVIWTIRKVDVGWSCLRSLVFEAKTLNKSEYKLGANTHRHIYPESSIDKRRFSGASL